MHYTLTVEGSVLDTSVGKTPLTFVQGSGQIIPGLSEALVGLKKGEKKSVTVAPDKGYGLPNPQAVQKVPKKSFKDAETIKAGAVVTGDAGGRPFQARVTAVDAESVTLDLNHPLAGKTLNFEVEVVDLQPAAATAAAPAAQPQG
ncbi:MAG: hypothetical protein A2X36_13760 [Elusimicrobia bacterium GWA2_69_24]|nr:MAG: hypothetical protein A2X36_13760 [Elusimicrobia bacterium GWA2_69_24]